MKMAWDRYSEAEGIDHPRSSEMAHVGRWLSRVAVLMDQYLAHESDILALLGEETPERYIVLNQNRDEIRANGWFPGSIITFTVFRGNIEDYRTDDVYYYDWNLYPFREIPPPWLALISGNYGLRDVNYYPDFRDTLEKSNSFIERSGDPTVTVGIAINQGIIEDMLTILWPISLSWVTETFRSDNFSLLMSLLVESRYGEETSAKDILRRFVDAFAAKIHEKRAYAEVIDTLEKALQDGEILFASRNEKIDNFFSTFRKPLPWESWMKSRESVVNTGVVMSGSSSTWASELWNAPNWAYPLLTSLSGNKSDRLIERSYIAQTSRIGECTYSNKLTFSHTHIYDKKEEEKIRKYLSIIGIWESTLVEKMLSIQWKGKNIAYMRVLVPKSAALTGSTAWVTMDDTPTAREIVFSLDTPVGSTASKIVRYTVDIPWCSRWVYPISWYRQPWLQNLVVESR
jgi:Protein of unknown function (DUF4012)